MHDFPKSWPTLLPGLIVDLHKASEASDYAAINGILCITDSVFKKFLYQRKRIDLLLDFKYCLKTFASPLLGVFLKTAALIDSASMVSPVSVMKQLFNCQRLCVRIFYSLNCQELPVDHKEWMNVFRKYLIANYPVVENSVDGLAIVDEVRAAVCENISLYVEEEDFYIHLNDFVVAIWSLLKNLTHSSSRDQLAVTAIKFLTTVSTSVHHALFAAEGVILEICQSIVVPNVMLREEDEELFQMNYFEFIRRDIDGSDLDNRRRMACEILIGIARNYKQQVTEIVCAQIQHLLTSFSANPVTNWKDKDCAVYLVVTLASEKTGGSSILTDLIHVRRFFSLVILPELTSQDVNGFPMLKAGALKFFIMFRNQLSKEAVIQIFRDLDRSIVTELNIAHEWKRISKTVTIQIFHLLVRFLIAESNVVHSYAAYCIEKLLVVKDDWGRDRYTASDIAPFLVELLTNFYALKLPESEENQYIMKCIMVVLGVAELSSEVAGSCISALTSILMEVCKNPKNPFFNHYLFESVAVLVKRTCERDPSCISAFEAGLFPSLQQIFANDVIEFFTYAFQLQAQLIELNRPPIPPRYMQIFDFLLSIESWKKVSNIPALVRLLQAFLPKVTHELKQEGRLFKVLEVFEKLVSSPTAAEQGCYVLITVIESLEYDEFEFYIPTIWAIVFGQPEKFRAEKFVKAFLLLMSHFIVKHGSIKLVDSMNSVQANIFSLVVKQLWVPHLKLITGAIELKLVAVASTRIIHFLGECPAILDPANIELWGKMLDGIVTLLSWPEQDRVEEEQEMLYIAENVGNTPTFAHLYNAAKKEEDPLKDIKDPKEVLVASLAGLSSRFPGRYPQIINQYLDPANQAALLQLCNTYNCQII